MADKRARSARRLEDTPAALRTSDARAFGPTGAPAPDLPAGVTGVVTVDLAQLRANWTALARHVAPAECGAVVKADAYGVGAAHVIPALYAAGCRSFFVATLQEAREARKLAPGAAIYVLDGLLPETAREFAELGALPALSSLGEALIWAALAREGYRAPAVLHIDTGLHRLGMGAGELAELMNDADALRRLEVALVMSHLACADDAEHPMNGEQLAAFNGHLAHFPQARASLAASDGLMLGPAYHFDLVRPGYALYGGQAAPNRVMPVKPVVRVSARILKVQDVAPGGRVGYAASYRATERQRIATIAAGYADGVFRHASASNEAPGGAVAIRGKLAPIVGRVSMDLITVDVTDIGEPAPAAGDWVDLVGPDLSIEAVGAAAGTIGYEVLTRLGPRFQRIYRDAAE